jgi:hypothetical protein
VKDLVVDPDKIPAIIFEYRGQWRMDIKYFSKKLGEKLTYALFQTYYTLERRLPHKKRSKSADGNKTQSG